jgi:hypothetical protein
MRAVPNHLPPPEAVRVRKQDDFAVALSQLNLVLVELACHLPHLPCVVTVLHAALNEGLSRKMSALPREGPP